MIKDLHYNFISCVILSCVIQTCKEVSAFLEPRRSHKCEITRSRKKIRHQNLKVWHYYFLQKEHFDLSNKKHQYFEGQGYKIANTSKYYLLLLLLNSEMSESKRCFLGYGDCVMFSVLGEARRTVSRTVIWVSVEILLVYLGTWLMGSLGRRFQKISPGRLDVLQE